MPSPRPEAFRVAERFRLGLTETTRRGPAGDRLGKGVGASLEFQDRRAYVPGDDVRHLDWNAYARTDQLMVRLYREEILPRVELCVDASRSMSTTPEKAQLQIDLAALFVAVASASGFHVRTLRLGERPEVVEEERLRREGLELDDARPLVDCVEASLELLRPGSIRVLLSDFLSPFDPARLVRPLAARAGGLFLLQVLSTDDRTPPAGQALRLTDAETGEALDLVLDPRTLKRYQERLHRHAAGLSEECRRAAGRFVTVSTERALAELCRDDLAAEGLLVPA